MHAFTRFRLLLNANTHCAVDHASYAGRNAPILIPIRVGPAHQRLRIDQRLVADRDMVQDYES